MDTASTPRSHFHRHIPSNRALIQLKQIARHNSDKCLCFCARAGPDAGDVAHLPDAGGAHAQTEEQRDEQRLGPGATGRGASGS